jgi:hypothetical protein
MTAMKNQMIILTCTALMVSCGVKTGKNELQNTVPITGTWRLLTGTLIENGDSTVTDYTRNVSFIKIINDTHFAFLQHDLNQGRDSTAVFVAGGGRYTLTDSLYTEHLEYCSDRAWEGNDFSFTVTVKNDTLVQQGMEQVDEAGVNRLNIEKYVRIKP